jgi:hypothetical protein
VSSAPLPALYACHQCKLIGPAVTAVEHQAITGHAQERISDEIAARIREVWQREERSLIDGAPLESSLPPSLPDVDLDPEQP